jgi:hypothetical protein
VLIFTFIIFKMIYSTCQNFPYAMDSRKKFVDVEVLVLPCEQKVEPSHLVYKEYDQLL